MSAPNPNLFRDLADLARLPWFAVEEGRLVVSDRDVGPIIDMHTHLALAYVRPMQLDLHRLADETQHYLPTCCPFDLDVYINRNFTPEQLQRLTRDLTLGSLTRGGMRATHTIPNLTREMNELRIERSVILPIDFPVLSDNAGTAAAAARDESRLLAYGSVHPYSSDVEGKLDAQAHRGALGVKVHPNVQVVLPDDRRAMRLYRAAGARNLPILIHCGPVGIEPALGRWMTQVRHYEKPIAENPRTKFVLGHSGALQMDQALALANKYDNVWLETSSQSLTNIRTICEKASPDRIVFGSDWPFYHQAVPLAKVLLATERDLKLRSKILYRNAAELLGMN